MTERKVINKYFPPDYDPNKIPRLRRGHGRRQFNIRTMAPFNMRCNTCNGYIYKAKKFNSRMETAENVDYLGLRHFRFFIRCPICCAEIIWRTDLESGDYVLEGGAKRNFEALKTAEELEAKRQAEEEEELANNPMKLLEKRTDQSKQEMEMMEVIEDLKELNQRHAGMDGNHNLMLKDLWKEEEAGRKAEEEADELLIKELLASRNKKPSTSKSDSYEEVIITTVASSQATSTQPSTVTSSKSATLHGPPRNLAPAVSKPSLSYTKRQLLGAVIKPRTRKVSTSSLSSNSIPSYDCPLPSKAPKLNPSTSQLASASSSHSGTKSVVEALTSLPGLTYSDHSDSD